MIYLLFSTCSLVLIYNCVFWRHCSDKWVYHCGRRQYFFEWIRALIKFLMVISSLQTILLSQRITFVKLSVTCYSFFFLLAVHVVAYGFNYYFLASGPASHACFFDTTVYSSDAFIRVGATLYGTLPGMITHNLISERQTFSSWTITFHILCVHFRVSRFSV